MNEQKMHNNDGQLPLTVDIAYSQALDHYNRQHYADADKLCTAIIKAVPNHVDSINLLGVIAQKVNRHDLAIEQFYNALKIDNSRSLLYYNLSISLNQLGRDIEAIHFLKAALNIEPKNSDINNLLNTILKNSTVLTQTEYLQTNAFSLLDKGLALYNAGKFEEAAKKYQQAIYIYPLYADAHCNFGVALQELGKLDKAINCFQQAIIIKPDHVTAIYNLGYVLQICGSLDEAITNYQKALTINPDIVEAYSNMGVALQELGQTDKASESLHKAIQKNPNFPTDLKNLGESLLVQHKIKNEVTIPFLKNNNNNNLSKKIETNLDFNQTHSKDKNFAKAYCHETALKEFTKQKIPPLKPDNIRILLLQPPNWKIPSQGEKPYPSSQGGDPTRKAEDISLDASSATYGLLSIAAQVLASNRKVLICNLSDFTWQNVEKFIKSIDVDLIGLTCMSHNLRGVAAITKLIREAHPKAHIVAGGTHATALYKETLKHFSAIDTIVIGEGEDTFLNIIEHIESNKSLKGIAGTAYRDDENQIKLGPFRDRINDLDKLASPHDYFTLHLLITSRGCPFRCTFCGSEVQWGTKLKMNSTEHVLQQLENIVNKNKINALAIKDDTFTAIRKRTLNICQQIVKRGLNFIWSCDTRVNSLDEEVLYAMRMAGCQQISVGVESGSPEI
ncbi:MAG: tetratricopeptide repeat protein, partial [Magnetococcales bacterium]|nr:tetratricopeptide repeat protein [Magnetococcales bacterium]